MEVLWRHCFKCSVIKANSSTVRKVNKRGKSLLAVELSVILRDSGYISFISLCNFYMLFSLCGKGKMR